MSKLVRLGQGFIWILFLALMLVSLTNVGNVLAFVLPTIGEVNTNNTHGLRIIVTVNLPPLTGDFRVRVTAASGEYMTWTTNTFFRSTIQTTFLFYPNIISQGERFNVCVTILSTKQIECTTGVNSAASRPEYVDIDMPAPKSQGINWGAICRSYDALIVEPCETLTTPDGYTLTREGQRVFLVCIGGSALALLLGHPELVQPIGSAARCGGTSSSTDAGLTNLLQGLVQK